MMRPADLDALQPADMSKLKPATAADFVPADLDGLVPADLNDLRPWLPPPYAITRVRKSHPHRGRDLPAQRFDSPLGRWS